MGVERRQYAVIGLGPFSRTVCKALHGMGHEVVAIDPHPDIVQEVHDAGIATHVVQADPEHVQALRELDLAQFDAVIVGRGTDFEASVVTVLALLEVGVQHIVAKAVHERHALVLARVGGERVRVVYPEQDMGLRLALQLTGQDIIEAVWHDPDHSFVERPLPAGLAGCSVAEAQARVGVGVLLIGLRRDEGLLVLPSPDLTLAPTDRLVLLGRNARLEALGT